MEFLGIGGDFCDGEGEVMESVITALTTFVAVTFVYLSWLPSSEGGSSFLKGPASEPSVLNFCRGLGVFCKGVFARSGLSAAVTDHCSVSNEDGGIFLLCNLWVFCSGM